MSGISTTSVPQAEAFVSVAALFLVFGPSAKEEKVVLRLPAVWKDLWADFVVIRTDLADSVDRDALRAIRKTVEGLSTAQEEGTNNQSIASSESTNGKTIILNSQTVPGGRVLDSLRIAEMWKMKISSSHYRHMEQSRSSLPIWNYKQELLEVIDHNQIVIICGETGCGKSTQVPAFILENELSNGRLCKIYCTEPRRISAISLARRVSQELGEHKNDVGTSRSLVGYAIRLESHVTETTSLVYATAGIVMRMLERGNDLEDITHLVLDEVHERTIDSDFLLIILRKILHRRPNLKIVLMSATVNAEQFSRYLNGAPIMTIPGRTFPVDTRYLEDAIEATRYTQSHHEANPAYDEEDDDTENGSENKANAISTTYSAHTQQTLATFDEYRIDYELIVKLIQTIATQHSYVEYSQAILVFLPGIAEIRRLNDMLSGDPTFSRQWLIYPLHSTIATEEQEHAFLVPPQGMRKIVLATNIAETGITIPDVTCVVDTGKHKEMRFDERRQLSRLLESFISRANAKQRRGRAGRVQNGLCFHLFTKSRHDNLMAEQQNPEMLRLSLQDLVLRVKLCKIGGIEQTLSEALDPPSPKNVRRAIDALVDVKALTPSEELTPLGKQLARLPLDVFLGKLILLGTIYKCLDACLTIAAILSAKSPFSAAMGARAQADMARLTFKKGDSDLLTVYNAYCAWRRVCQQGGSEFQFCRKNFLSPQTLGNIEDLKAQLATTLVEAGFLQLNDGERASLNR
jgi:ATP-dependent RNA helicase DHX29